MRKTGAGLPAEFWRLWWAGTVNNIGDGAWRAAIPLLAAELTRDPRMVAAVSVATYLPLLVFSIPAGFLVDRFSRTTLMSVAQVGQLSLVVLLGLLTAVHVATVPTLCVISFLVGCADTIVNNAEQAIVPQFVEPDRLIAANARQQISQTVSNYLIGPPFGSLLFAIAIGLPFGFDGLTFAVSAVLLFSLPRTAVGRTGGTRLSWESITVGVRWLVRQRLLRVLAFLIGLNNFCNLLAQATLVLLAVEHFGMSERSYGLLLGAMAIGGVVGGMLNSRLSERFGWLPSMLFALAVNAASYLAVGLAPNAVVLAVLMSLSGFALTLWNVASLSIRQTLIPQDMFGRVNSVFRMLSWGFMPLGAAVGGFVAHDLGVVAPFPIAGGLRTIGLLIALPVLLRAHREVAEPAAGQPVG